MPKNHYREPIGHTCPDIDKVLLAVRYVLKVTDCRNATPEELKDIVDDIADKMYGLEDILEKLRKSNDELREWGLTEAYEVDRLEEQLELLQNVEV